MTTALEGGEGSASRPGRSLPPGKFPVPILHDAVWAPGPVWTGADRPARSQSLYRLRYSAHLVKNYTTEVSYEHLVLQSCVRNVFGRSSTFDAIVRTIIRSLRGASVLFSPFNP